MIPKTRRTVQAGGGRRQLLSSDVNTFAQHVKAQIDQALQVTPIEGADPNPGMLIDELLGDGWCPSSSS